jgi:hypothetical protein
MQVTKANSCSKTSFASPFAVRRDDDLPARVFIAIVDIKLQLLSLVSLNQREEVFALMENRISANDVIAERAKTSCLSRRRRMDLQNVPNIFIRSFKATESNRNTEESLTAPSL